MAIDQATGSARKRVMPHSHEAVFENLNKVVELGFGHPGLRGAVLDDLLADARIFRYGRDDADLQDEETSDAEIIEYAVRHAVNSWPDDRRARAEALFGLAEATRGHKLKKRREAAIEAGVLDITVGTFRTHHERLLVADVARCVCCLADERILKDWEVQLESREAELKTPIEPNREPGGMSAELVELQVAIPSREAQPNTEVLIKKVEVEPEPETLGEGFYLAGTSLGTIYRLIFQQFDPGKYRQYVARNPSATGIRHSPRPVRTPLEYAVAISLGLGTLFLVCAIVVGIFVILRFFAGLLVGI